MTSFVARLAVALLVLVLHPGAVAQPVASVQDNDFARITFRLTLYGDVPADEGFSIFFFEAGATDDKEAEGFCGPNPYTAPKQDCEGGGRVYEFAHTLWPRGRAADFAFLRSPGASSVDDAEVLFGEVRAITADTVVSAYHDYRTGRGGELPAEMPDAGAGAMASSGIPVVPLAAALPVLVVAAHTLRYSGKHRPEQHR